MVDINELAAKNVVNQLLEGQPTEPLGAPYVPYPQKASIPIARHLISKTPKTAGLGFLGAIPIEKQEVKPELAWYQHITIPVIEALEKYQTNVIEPMAASIWSMGVQALPGIQKGEIQARQIFREKGFAAPWTEAGKEISTLYRETTLPKGMKGFLELVGDPLMYIGLVAPGVGLIGKAGKIGALTARLLKPAAMADRIITKALSLPIELPLKGIAKAAGKLAYLSPTIAGEYAGRTSFNAFRTITGKAFVKGSKKDTAWVLKRVMELPEHQLDAHEILVRQSIETVAHSNPERAVAFVNNLSRQNPRQAAEMLARRVNDITQSNRVKAIYQGFEKRGVMGSMQKVLYETYDAVWGKALKPVNLFFSRAILMFGMFTPMNVLEWGGRMAEQGVLPWGSAGLDHFRAFYAAQSVPLKSLFEEAGTGGIVAAGLGKVGSGQNWLGRVVRGMDKGFFGWGRRMQSGMERYFFETTDKKFLIEGMRRAGIARCEVMKEATSIMRQEIQKPAFKGLRRRLQADLEHAVLTGDPEVVLALSELYQVPTVKKKLVNSIILKHPEVSPASLNYLNKATPDMLAREAPEIFARMREIEREVLEYSPQVVEARMDELVASLGARNLRLQADVEATIGKIFAGAPKAGAESDIMLRAFADQQLAGGFRVAESQKIWNQVRKQQLEHADNWLNQVNRGIEELNQASLKQGGIGIPKRARDLYKQKALAQVEYKKRAIEQTTEFWEMARAEGWSVEEISFNLNNNLQPNQANLAFEYGRAEAELTQKIEKAWIDLVPPQKRAYKATLAKYKDQLAAAQGKAEAIKGKLTERINSLKNQLEKTADALREEKAISQQLVSEKAMLGELPPDDVLEATFRTLSPEVKMDFSHSLQTSLKDIDETLLTDAVNELAGVKEFMQTDPIAAYRALVPTVRNRSRRVSLFSILDRYGGQFPETLTKREAQALMLGRPIRPSVLNKQGKVMPEYILDEIASQFGMNEQQFKDALEFAWRQNRKLRELNEVIAYYESRRAEINRVLEILERSGQPPAERIRAEAAEAATEIPKAEAGMPEAGIQEGMFGERKEVFPAGKGEITQMNLDDWQKLQEYDMPEVGRFKSEPMGEAQIDAGMAKAQRQAYEEVIDTLEKALEPKMADIDAMEREFMEAAMEPLLTKNGQAELKATTTKIADTIRKLPADTAAEYKAVRQEAIDKTVEAYKKIFIPPESRNSVDYFMQHFFPYWMYESRRFSYLGSLFARRPIMAEYFFPGAGRVWQEDRGYINIPGTDWQVNPFRGTVLGTLARTAMKDYPPEHIGWRGEVEELLEDFGRVGLYFGPIYTMPLQTAMGEFGESLPAPMSSTLALGAGIGLPGVAEVQEALAPSRFRQYYADQILAKQGIIPEQATIEQRAEALKKANLSTVLMEQSAMTRFRPEARREYYDAIAKKMQEFTGLTQEQQDELRQKGLNIRDVYSLSPMQEEELRNIEGAEFWGSISQKLLPRAQQQIVVARNEYYRTLDMLREAATSQQTLDDNRLREGVIDGKTWRDRYYERQIQVAAYSDALKASPAYKDVPVSTEEWEAYRQRFNIPEGYTHPIQEVLNRYYAIDPESFVNPETGETDWGAFQEAREDAIAPFDPETREIALEWAHRRDTPMITEFRKAQDTLGDYWDIYDRVKREHPTWARVVEEEEKETDPVKALEIRQKPEYKAFRDELNRRRKELRLRDPMIEYYLYAFGYITSLTNPKALEMVRSKNSLLQVSRSRIAKHLVPS